MTYLMSGKRPIIMNVNQEVVDKNFLRDFNETKISLTDLNEIISDRIEEIIIETTMKIFISETIDCLFSPENKTISELLQNLYALDEDELAHFYIALKYNEVKLGEKSVYINLSFILDCEKKLNRNDFKKIEETINGKKSILLFENIIPKFKKLVISETKKSLDVSSFSKYMTMLIRNDYSETVREILIKNSEKYQKHLEKIMLIPLI